jgi:multidrug efflux pump subunit AcrB
LTPVIIGLLLKGEDHAATPGSWFGRFHQGFEHGFDRFRRGYTRMLTLLLKRRWIVPVAAVLMLALGGVMVTFAGRDFFPEIDGGQIQLHVRAPAATRIEATERIFQEVENKIREIVPERDRALMVDDIGVPQRVYNLAFTDGSTINVNDGVILISLKDGHAPTAGYVRRLREVLPAAFPSVTFYFQAADMTTQILNFGLPAQIDVRVLGRDRANNVRVAQELRRRIAAIPGIADAHLQQELDAPAGRGRCSLASTRKTSPTTSIPASAPRNRSRRIFGRIPPTVFPITSPSRPRSIRQARSVSLPTHRSPPGSPPPARRYRGS